MKPLSKNIILFLLVILVVAAIFSNYRVGKEKPEVIGINTLVQYIHQKSVSSLTVAGDDIEVTLTNEQKAKTRKESDESLSDLLTNYGVTAEELNQVDIRVKDSGGRAYLL